MIYVTGDTHGAHDLDKISPFFWPEGQRLTRNDLLVICGDFGAIWSGGNRDREPRIETSELDEFLQDIDDRLNKDCLVMWYAGHHHMDRELDDQHCVLYQEVVELGGAPLGP